MTDDGVITKERLRKVVTSGWCWNHCHSKDDRKRFIERDLKDKEAVPFACERCYADRLDSDQKFADAKAELIESVTWHYQHLIGRTYSPKRRGLRCYFGVMEQRRKIAKVYLDLVEFIVKAAPPELVDRWNKKATYQIDRRAERKE